MAVPGNLPSCAGAVASERAATKKMGKRIYMTPCVRISVNHVVRYFLTVRTKHSKLV